MEISEEQRDLLKKRYAENGDCRSCGWLCAYYEVQYIIEEKFIEKDFEEDGSIYIPCHANNGEDNSDHRGSNIYNFTLDKKDADNNL